MPLIAMLADRRGGETWTETVRRSAGLLVVLTGWGVWKLLTLAAGLGAVPSLSLTPSNFMSATIHLVQVTFGLEFRGSGSAIGHWTPWALVIAVLVGATAVIGARSATSSTASTSGLSVGLAFRLGLAWAVLGLLPTIPVASIWSAYFYLWSLFGVALAMAAASRTFPPIARVASLAVIVCLSTNARALDEFSVGGGDWSWRSHVNQHYIDRSLTTIDGYLRQLRSARPRLPARSTVFFADVAPSAGFQTADGPLLRWAYRDTTLRSWFLTQFTRERASRGPVFFFVAKGDLLEDHTEDEQFLPSLAYSSMLAEKPQPAADALDLALASSTGEPRMRYWRAIIRSALGDSGGSRADFAALRMSGTAATVQVPEWHPHEQDTTARIAMLRVLVSRAPEAPQPHARLSALLLARGEVVDGAIEAYAFRTLAPDSADAWRKWASAQLTALQFAPALTSLEHYLAIRKAQGIPDAEAEQVASNLRRLLHGDVASEAVR